MGAYNVGPFLGQVNAAKSLHIHPMLHFPLFPFLFSFLPFQSPPHSCLSSSLCNHNSDHAAPTALSHFRWMIVAVPFRSTCLSPASLISHLSFTLPLFLAAEPTRVTLVFCLSLHFHQSSVRVRTQIAWTKGAKKTHTRHINECTRTRDIYRGPVDHVWPLFPLCVLGIASVLWDRLRMLCPFA